MEAEQFLLFHQSQLIPVSDDKFVATVWYHVVPLTLALLTYLFCRANCDKQLIIRPRKINVSLDFFE
jgi:hypothetical protein